VRPLHIGLTGGIGSGKSTVAQLLVQFGAALVDTDAIARSLTAAHGAALPAIAHAFGAEMISAQDGLDRDRMRALAFSDASARQGLEAILHPLIGEQARSQAALATQAGAPAVVFDVPLLAESGHWRTRVDWVLVVDCTLATQVHRVMLRNGWAEDTVRRVIAQQSSRERRRSLADAVIFNDSISRELLNAQVRSLWKHWVAG
jgi:dephospho-CoA kinase